MWNRFKTIFSRFIAIISSVGHFFNIVVLTDGACRSEPTIGGLIGTRFDYISRRPSLTFFVGDYNMRLVEQPEHAGGDEHLLGEFINLDSAYFYCPAATLCEVHNYLILSFDIIK